MAQMTLDQRADEVERYANGVKKLPMFQKASEVENVVGMAISLIKDMAVEIETLKDIIHEGAA